MLPVLLGAAALWGISNMAEAEENVNKANKINEQAAEIANAANQKVKNAHSSMTSTLNKLGKTKMQLMSGNISEVADIMGKVYKNFKLNKDTKGLKELEDAGFNETLLGEMENLSTKAIELSETSEFKVNENGGLCAVGALGGAVLGFGMIAAPAMLLYSFMQSDEAEAALYEAKTRLDEAKVYEQRSENICALFKAISTRGNQINNLLNVLNIYFDSAVEQMNEVTRIYKYDFRNYPPEGKALLFYTWQIAKTVKIIVDTSLIQEDWSINPNIDNSINIGKRTLELLSSGD